MIAATSIVVADDHPAMLAAVSEVLGRHGFDVVGRAPDGEQALALIEQLKPTIALVDMRMPRLTGIAVAARTASISPETSVVLYTAYGERALLAEALDVGARGFVLKESPLSDIVRAIEHVVAGETYVDPVLAGFLVRGDISGRLTALTERERDVLRLLADGLTNDEIAASLDISPETVRTHVRKAMARLDADTRTQAVATALRQSIIS